MKSIGTILSTLLADISAALPSLITAAGLENFDTYAIGQSRNPKEKGLFIYKSDYRTSVDNESLTMIIQAQLSGIDEETSADYEDVLLDYFRTYNPQRIGATGLDSIDSDTWPIERSQGTFIFMYLSFSQDKDGCDG